LPQFLLERFFGIYSGIVSMKTTIFFILLSMLAVGCSRLNLFAPSPQVVILHNGNAAYCPISYGETVTTALNQVPSHESLKPTTVVLVSRGPEGIVQKRLDCDTGLRLVDWRQDQCLRDGDQLIMPVAVGPAGLTRPSAPGIPVSE
jgi:hypothetical protein